jgi:hypothetical protein
MTDDLAPKTFIELTRLHAYIGSILNLRLSVFFVINSYVGGAKAGNLLEPNRTGNPINGFTRHAFAVQAPPLRFCLPNRAIANRRLPYPLFKPSKIAEQTALFGPNICRQPNRPMRFYRVGAIHYMASLHNNIYCYCMTLPQHVAQQPTIIAADGMGVPKFAERV